MLSLQQIDTLGDDMPLHALLMFCTDGAGTLFSPSNQVSQLFMVNFLVSLEYFIFCYVIYQL
jgi:hypothetical protein